MTSDKEEPTVYISLADYHYLKSFVEEVLVVCKNDFEGVTSGLDDMAMNAGQILGLDRLYMESLD
jgi:hypothetical protein